MKEVPAWFLNEVGGSTGKGIKKAAQTIIKMNKIANMMKA